MIDSRKPHHEGTEQKREKRGYLFLFFSVISVSPWCGFSSIASEPLPKFERIVIDDNFPGGYQVEVADVNGDGKPDIVGVGGSTCAWYENPSWKKRIVTTGKQTPGIISSATIDLDGDGKAEIAIAYEFEMNEPSKGKLLLASQGQKQDDPWMFRSITDFGSIHRLRWADFEHDKKPELVVAPLFGPLARAPKFEDEAQLMVIRANKDFKNGPWEFRTVASRPVLHAIKVYQDLPMSIVTADNLGVALFTAPPNDPFNPAIQTWEPIMQLPGFSGPAPKRGASEIQLGNFSKQEIGFLATIEPWHGHQVTVTTIDSNDIKKPPVRTVIDTTLDDGHALWVADVDGDGDDEIFAGHRGKDHRVSAYDFDGKEWKRTIIDREIAAQDLRGGDLDGDGAPDVVAIGGKTHNVVWYRPIREKSPVK